MFDSSNRTQKNNFERAVLFFHMHDYIVILRNLIPNTVLLNKFRKSKKTKTNRKKTEK